MLIATSGYINEQVSLITLGHTCRYLVTGNKGSTNKSSTLFDVGLTAHINPLLARLKAAKIDNLERIVLTHLDCDRIAAIPKLKHILGQFHIVGSPDMQALLEDSTFVRQIYEEDKRLSKIFPGIKEEHFLPFEEFFSFLKIDTLVKDSNLIELSDDIEARVFASPGHTKESLAFLLLPFRYLIVDEGFGYYRGRDSATPGADFSLEEARKTIHRFDDHEILALCLPYFGTITGTLISKHLSQIQTSILELQEESRTAFKDGCDIEYIKETVHSSFYESNSRDPLVQQALAISFEKICLQLTTQLTQSSTNLA